MKARKNITASKEKEMPGSQTIFWLFASYYDIYFEQYPNQIQTNKYILFSFLENADTNVSHNPEKLAGNARKELRERVKMIWRLLVNILDCCNIDLGLTIHHGIQFYSANDI